jgi:hypothetical protein
MPPWEIAPGGKALWWHRWKAWRDAGVKVRGEFGRKD